MSFREKILSKLYPLLQQKEPYFFLFCIGSFPQRPESNHEFPIILKRVRNNIKRIYIDPEYSTENQIDTMKRIGYNCYIYPKSINNNDYNMIIEFSHIAGIVNNSLSLILEFTGIQRLAQERKENRTSYLYISPSDCLVNAHDRSHNPIFVPNENRIEFYNPTINNISNEIEGLFQGDLTETKLEKMEYVKCLIDNYIKDIKEVYRMILNYVERKDLFDVEHNIVFIKDMAFFYPSLELLKKRMIGYQSHKTQNIIDDFLKSESNDLEIYIKEKIQNLLGIILLYNNQGDRHKVNNEFDKIMFNNSKEVYDIINKMNIVEI